MLLKCFPRQQRRCLRFQDEISAHMKYRHPHIMRIVDAFAMDQHVVLVFASGGGERLDSYIRCALWLMWALSPKVDSSANPSS